MNLDVKPPQQDENPALSNFVVPSYAPSRPKKLVVTLKWAKIVVFSLFGVALVLGLWGHSRWTHATNARLATLEAATAPAKVRPQRYDEDTRVFWSAPRRITLNLSPGRIDYPKRPAASGTS